MNEIEQLEIEIRRLREENERQVAQYLEELQRIGAENEQLHTQLPLAHGAFKLKCAENARLRIALKGVVEVADRDTIEFAYAREVLKETSSEPG